MKLKSLLFMVTLLLVCLGVRADNDVVFEQHFESEQTAASTDVGFYEYINSMTGDTRTVEDGALKIFNDPATLCKTERWQRAVKFRNLPLKEGNTYRLSFKLKGSKTYNDGETDVNCKLSSLLMQGEDNADISLFDFDGKEQRLEAEDFNPDEFVSYTKTIVFASEEKQKEEYAKQGKGELADKFFLTLSIYNPGTFFLKDVVLSKVGAVQSVGFGVLGAIKIDFGKNTNIAAMAEAAPKGLVMFGADEVSKYASATVNGAAAEIEAIEYHKDGALYVFLVDAVGEEDKIVVNFTNPTDERQIKYIGKETESSVFDIVDYEATYNSALDDVMSFLYLSPELISSYPANKAFSIDKNLSEFTFTFDHEVLTSNINAVLDRGGEEVPLVVKEGTPKTAETVVFVRNDNGLLAKNNRITLSNVLTEYTDYPVEFVINFEAGKPKVAEEIITPVQSIIFADDAVNTIPVGWTVVVNKTASSEGELRPSGSAQGSGPRLFAYSTGDYQKVLYLRATEADSYSTATRDEAVTLPAGENLYVDFMVSGYKNSGQKVRCEILDATTEEVIASQEKTTTESTPDGGPASLEKISFVFNNDAEKSVKLRYTVIASGYTETMFGGVEIYFDEMTEGDVPDDKNILVDPSFGGAGNNRSPKAESGWELWQAGEMRTFDTDFNYNGTRIFNDLGLKGLKIGYYCNGQWPNGFMQYGAANGEGAPKLALPQATLDFTLYAANWKENISREIHIQVLDEAGEKVYLDKTFNTSPVNMEASRGASYEADKFTFSWDCPKEGNYIVRFGSPAGETLIGNFSLIQPGSRAVKYYALLAQTVANAKAALEKVADPMYDGATKTALADGIAKYEDPDKITMTTEEEFKAAIEELDGLTKSMLTRYEYIPRFNTAYEAASKAYGDNIGSKYEKLDCYSVLEEVVTEYEGVDPSTLEDEVLIGATTSLEDNTTLFNNMKNTCVGLLTKQIVGLAAKLVELDETQVGDEYVLAADDAAISDDQDIAYQLKLRITKAIYDKCAEGDPFVKEELDPETSEPTGIMTPVEIDVTNFIQNAGFYSTDGWPGTVTGFPGWTIGLIAGKVGPSYGISSWAGERASELKPVVEASIRTDWGTHEHDASQLIDILPVAKCTASIIVGEDGGEPHEAYAYVGEGDAKVVKYYDGETPGEEGNKFNRDTNIPREFTDITPNVDEENVLGSILLGAHGHVNGGFSRIDNATIKLTGKVEDFDYAAAAAKLAGKITEIETVQQSNEPAEAPVKVVYYDLNGVATSAPQGIAIKVATYANGYMKVSKVVVK